MADRTLEDLAEDLREAASPEGLNRSLNAMMKGLTSEARKFMLLSYRRSGLGVQTNRLKGSLMASALTGSRQIGIVMRAGDRSQVVYAAIHEFGGTIVPVNGQYLTFKGSKGWARVQSVTIPARPYVKPALDQLSRRVPDDMRAVLRAKILGDKVRPL